MLGAGFGRVDCSSHAGRCSRMGLGDFRCSLSEFLCLVHFSGAGKHRFNDSYVENGGGSTVGVMVDGIPWLIDQERQKILMMEKFGRLQATPLGHLQGSIAHEFRLVATTL